MPAAWWPRIVEARFPRPIVFPHRIEVPGRARRPRPYEFGQLLHGIAEVLVEPVLHLVPAIDGGLRTIELRKTVQPDAVPGAVIAVEHIRLTGRLKRRIELIDGFGT